MRYRPVSSFCIFMVMATTVRADILNLNQYSLTGFFDMPAAAFETSAVTYNWDRDSLVVVDDEGFDVVEISKTGVQLGRILLSNHPPQGGLNVEDTEGITYLGGDNYMIGQERNRNVFTFQTTFPAVVQTINLSDPVQTHRNQLFTATDNVGNSGLEGISFDPMTNTFLGAKEKTPLELYRFIFDPVGSQATTSILFTPAIISALGVTDFSDIQSLGAVPAFAGTGREDNFLVLSEESSVLLELDSDGTLLSTLDLNSITADWAHEGVTIDHAGNIYIVAEEKDNATSGRMFVFAVPEPCSATLLLLTVALVAGQRRRSPVSRELC